jgi:hypothetical protein
MPDLPRTIPGIITPLEASEIDLEELLPDLGVLNDLVVPLWDTDDEEEPLLIPELDPDLLFLSIDDQESHEDLETDHANEDEHEAMEEQDVLLPHEPIVMSFGIGVSGELGVEDQTDRFLYIRRGPN